MQKYHTPNGMRCQLLLSDLIRSNDPSQIRPCAQALRAGQPPTTLTPNPTPPHFRDTGNSKLYEDSKHTRKYTYNNKHIHREGSIQDSEPHGLQDTDVVLMNSLALKLRQTTNKT